MNPFVVLLLGVSAAAWLGKGIVTKNAAEKLTFTFKDFIISRVEWLNTYLYLRFEINNPTGTPLRIQDYQLSVEYQGQKIADITIKDTNKTIQPNADTLFTVPLKIDNLTTGKTLYLNIIKNKPLQPLTIKGYIKVNDFTSDINEEIPLKLFA